MSKTTSIALISGIVLAAALAGCSKSEAPQASSSSAASQPAQPKKLTPQERASLLWRTQLRALDTNQDARVSKAEFEEGIVRQFDILPKDAKGHFQLKDLRTFMRGSRAQQGGTVALSAVASAPSQASSGAAQRPSFMLLGTVFESVKPLEAGGYSREEFQKAAPAVFATLDKDGSGSLDEADLGEWHPTNLLTLARAVEAPQRRGSAPSGSALPAAASSAPSSAASK